MTQATARTAAQQRQVIDYYMGSAQRLADYVDDHLGLIYGMFDLRALGRDDLADEILELPAMRQLRTSWELLDCLLESDGVPLMPSWSRSSVGRCWRISGTPCGAGPPTRRPCRPSDLKHPSRLAWRRWLATRSSSPPAWLAAERASPGRLQPPHPALGQPDVVARCLAARRSPTPCRRPGRSRHEGCRGPGASGGC